MDAVVRVPLAHHEGRPGISERTLESSQHRRVATWRHRADDAASMMPMRRTVIAVAGCNCSDFGSSGVLNTRHFPNSASERQGASLVFADHRAGSAGRAPHPARRAEVEAKTGFKRAHIYSLMKEGQFQGALAWACAPWADRVEVEQWIADRLNERA